VFADAVLRRAALRRRHRWGQGFDPLAGSVVRTEDVDRLVLELPAFADGQPPGLDADGHDLDADVEEARRSLHDDEGVLNWLAAIAGLDRPAIEVLALAVAVAWSPVRLRLLGYIQDDLTARGLQVASIPALLDLDDDAVHVVAPGSELRRSCLVEIDQAVLTGAALVLVPATVQWLLKGDQSRDPDLPAGALMYSGPPAPATGWWLVHGRDRVRRLQAAAERVGTSRLLVSPVPLNEGEWAAVVRTAVCGGFAVVLETATFDAVAGAWLQRCDAVPWIVSTRHPLPLEDLPALSFVEVAADNPPAADHEVIEALGEIPAGHRLGAEQLQMLRRIDGIDPADAVRRLASGELDRLSYRVHPRRTWDDLILPPDRLSKIREVIARVRHRDLVYDDWSFPAVPSSGVVALFAGPPGTGKTMSAEIIAGDLGLDMFKVDLSNVVSKYIGETEKHLERVFSAAEASAVLLVFDEADALFGKRTQVSDAHDRYANLETSYLLQRLEVYEGLTILTSNLASNIDDAFLRRVHVFVEFPMPEESERRAIWLASFPKEAPVEDVDVDFLAVRFPLSGGSIRTAALTAAFAAAAEGGGLSMSHVIYGLMREYQKLGRMITPEQFGDWTGTAVAHRAGERPGT
jgi:hypothetical protein